MTIWAMRVRQRGFTLIEIMLVVLIIGILSSLAIPIFQGITARANRSEAHVVVGKMRVYFVSLYESTGTYESAAAKIGDVVLTNPPAAGPVMGQAGTWDSSTSQWKDLTFPPEGPVKMRYFYKVLAIDEMEVWACGNFPGFGSPRLPCGDLGNSANYTYVEHYRGASQIAGSPFDIPSM